MTYPLQLRDTTVWFRARAVNPALFLPSAFSASVSATVSALTGVSALAATSVDGSGAQLTIAWTRATLDGAVFDIEARAGADPYTPRLTAAAGSLTAMLDGSLVSTAYDVRVRARIVSTGAISAWSTTTQTTSSTSVTLAGPTAVQVASDGQGTYRVTAVVGGTPLPLLDADSASETGVGSDTYRTPESIRRGTPDAYGLAMVSASAPNDGLRRRLRVRAVSGAGVSNWVTASPDVTPYTVQQITPAGTAAITSTSLFRDVSPFNIYIDGFTVSGAPSGATYPAQFTQCGTNYEVAITTLPTSGSPLFLGPTGTSTPVRLYGSVFMRDATSTIVAQRALPSLIHT